MKYSTRNQMQYCFLSVAGTVHIMATSRVQGKGVTQKGEGHTREIQLLLVLQYCLLGISHVRGLKLM